MAITAAMVKELREITGAGMMDCKKALTETDGDLDKAIDVLREKGQAKAAKKAGRIAAEGLCMIASEGDQKAIVVEVNSETDFVAKNEKFKNYVAAVADQVLKSDAADLDAFLAEPWAAEPEKTVNDKLVEQISVIGEKLSIRRFEKMQAQEEGEFLTYYTHMGGKICVIVDAVCAVKNEAVSAAMTQVAMQICAMSPRYVSRKEVDQEFLDHEKEILLAQIMNDPKESQKPEKVIQGIVQGRVNKELKEYCLLDQEYVLSLEGKQTVQQYLDQVAKEAGSPISVKRFIRLETGEGIEKKQENFAEEVAKQMGL